MSDGTYACLEVNVAKNGGKIGDFVSDKNIKMHEFRWQKKMKM